MNNNKASKLGKPIFLVLFVLSAIWLISFSIAKKQSNLAELIDMKIYALSSGDDLIDEEDVLTTIERSFGHRLVGVSIGGLNVERIERVLKNDPFIQNANVHIDAKNVIHIVIHQREPLIRVIDKNGLNYYLDFEGEKMPLSDHFTARVIVATGNIPPHDPGYLERDENIINHLFRLTRFIQNDKLLKPLIEQVHIDKDNEFVLVPKLGNQKIYFGAYENVDNKIFRLKTFYKEAMPRMGWQKYKTINLKNNNQVVCQKR